MQEAKRSHETTPVAEQLMLERLYAAFNARDIDTVLAALHPDVDWPNGWEGGRVHGPEAVREYWTRQWAVLDPSVSPKAFSTDVEGRIVVDVHAVIRDREARVVAEHDVEHVYAFQAGLVRRMDIREV